MSRIKALVYISAVLSVLFANGTAEAVNVTVNPAVEHQIFEGWGTSICWWGNIIGKYPETTRDSIMDLFFDTTNGLGLSIIRYNIGGGDDPAHNHMGTGKMMEGFKESETAQYDWNRDAAQRRVVDAAKERIPDEWFIAEAFANSPPYWMTVSGCAAGGPDGDNNLKSNYYTQFADYLTTVVNHFEEEWGISFRTLEPMNEPDMGWTEYGGQEGCSYSHENQAKLIRAVQQKIEEKQLSTEISAPDGSSYGATIAAYNSYDSDVKACIAQVNTHGYFGGSRTDLHAAAERDSKRLWASEIDGSGADYPFDQWEHDHDDIIPGLDIANRIIRDLRDLKAHGWVFWQIVESEQAQSSLNKNWGAIHADFNGGNRYYITKKYHVIRQFSYFIRPFSQMINIDNEDAVAFLSPQQDQLIIVQRNASDGDVSYDYSLTNFQQIGSAASVWRSSGTENFRKVDDISVSNGTLSAISSAQSVTTYIIPVQYGASGFSLTVNTTGDGRVIKDPSSGGYEEGTVVTLTAEPEQGWEFVSWSGDGISSSEISIDVAMDSDKTVSALFSRSPDEEGNYVLNGDFSSDADDWTLNVWEGDASGSVVDGEYQISIESIGSENHQIQLVQPGLFLENGKTYQVSFDAYTESARELEVDVEMAEDPWDSYLSELEYFDLTTENQRYSFTFTMDAETDVNGRLSFNAGASTEDVYIDNASLKEYSTSVSVSDNINKIRDIMKVNCSKSIVTVEFKGNVDSRADIRLYNLRGKMVDNVSVSCGADGVVTHEFDLENMSDGVYVVKVHSGKGEIIGMSKSVVVVE